MMGVLAHWTKAPSGAIFTLARSRDNWTNQALLGSITRLEKPQAYMYKAVKIMISDTTITLSQNCALIKSSDEIFNFFFVLQIIAWIFYNENMIQP